jgi:hypothetical protein
MGFSLCLALGGKPRYSERLQTVVLRYALFKDRDSLSQRAISRWNRVYRGSNGEVEVFSRGETWNIEQGARSYE